MLIKKYLVNRLKTICDDPEDTAEWVLYFFGYEDRMLDALLKPPERNLFYKMENAGIIRSISEEVKLIDGRSWRIYQWVITEEENPPVEEKIELLSVYETLSREKWKR